MPSSPQSASQSAIYRAQYGGYPKDLIESELFGHEKGAFTGAIPFVRGVLNRLMAVHYFSMNWRYAAGCADAFAARTGRWSVYRVGGYAPVKVDVRIIAATTRILNSGCRKASSVRICSTAERHPRSSAAAARTSGRYSPLARHFLQVAARELGVEAKLLIRKPKPR